MLNLNVSIIAFENVLSRWISLILRSEKNCYCRSQPTLSATPLPTGEFILTLKMTRYTLSIYSVSTVHLQVHHGIERRIKKKLDKNRTQNSWLFCFSSSVFVEIWIQYSTSICSSVDLVRMFYFRGKWCRCEFEISVLSRYPATRFGSNVSPCAYQNINSRPIIFRPSEIKK